MKFGRKTKKETSVDETQFYLLHLSLMRDYLALEFNDIKETLPFDYDLESIIDDWVNCTYSIIIISFCIHMSLAFIRFFIKMLKLFFHCMIIYFIFKFKLIISPSFIIQILY